MNGPTAATNPDGPPWLRRAARVNLALGAGFVVTFVFFAFRARFTIPYIDDWSWLASLQDRPFTRGLWLPHNEHIIVIPRLLLWLDFWVWGWPGYATLLAALASHAAIAGVFVRACLDRDRDEARLLIGSVLVLTFLTYELQGTVFPAAVLFPLVLAFATLAIACLANAAAPGGARSSLRWVALSALMSVMAMLCLTNGLVVPFIVAGLSWRLRLPRPATMLLLIVGVAGVVARLGLGRVGPSAFAASAPATVRFALAMLAGPVASLSPRLAVAIGAVFAVVALWSLWRFLRAPDRTLALLVGTIAFVTASVCMASSGRAQFDLSVAAESRYTELVAVGWVSLLLIAWPSGFARRPIGKLATVLLPIVAALALPLQVFVGQIWAVKADHLDVASLALTVGVDDQDWVWRIHPLGAAYIDPVLPLLRSHHVRFLEFPDRGQLAPPAVPRASCDGAIEAIDPGDASSGLRVQGRIRERGRTLRVLDGESRVRGLAKPAPLVPQGRAMPNDFVWAELDVLRGTMHTDDEWLGFSAWGSGPPFKAELLDAGGRVLCQVPVGCCRQPAPPPRQRELVVRGSLPEGWLDTADCGTIAGWAWDSARPNEPMDVRIAISNGQDMTVAASSFRKDLFDQGKGSGEHGFAVTAPSLAIGPGVWRVSVSVASTGVPLAGSPKTVTCPQ